MSHTRPSHNIDWDGTRLMQLASFGCGYLGTTPHPGRETNGMWRRGAKATRKKKTRKSENESECTRPPPAKANPEPRFTGLALSLSLDIYAIFQCSKCPARLPCLPCLSLCQAASRSAPFRNCFTMITAPPEPYECCVRTNVSG